MKSRFRAVRVAMVVVSAVGVGAVMNGCSAGADGSEQTGETNQAFIQPKHPNTITWETGPADPNAAGTCYNYTIAVPPALAEYGCTQGVEFSTHPFEVLYAFACKGAPNPLPVQQANQDGATLLGLPSPGPSHESVYAGNAWLDNACFGSADPGWILVVDDFNFDGCGHGCPGSACGCY